ncbi:type IV secretion system protein [Rickettsiales bacterium]|nr:type IV secretion system protein [Rickettsiales bacterium]
MPYFRQKVKNFFCSTIFKNIILTIVSFGYILNSFTPSYGAYRNNIYCFKNFLGVSDYNLPPEGQRACTAGRVALIAVTAVGTQLLGGIFLASLATAATVGQNNSELCDYSIHPLPLTDGQIGKILKNQNITPTIRLVTDYYNKICIKYDGDSFWIEKDKCVWKDGLLFCASSPDWCDTLVCGYIVSTCPCVGSVGGGTLNDPDYDKDDNGAIKADSNGNPSIKNKDDYKKYFARHCNMITDDTGVPLLPAEYTGIIDDICNNWKGYSKTKLPLTSGAVQCMQETMANLFQKPVPNRNSAPKQNLNISPEQKARLNLIESDEGQVVDLSGKAKAIISDRKGNLASDPRFQGVASQINAFSSLSAFSSEFKKDYLRLDVLKISPSEAINLVSLNNTIVNLDSLYKSIESRKSLFLESALSSGQEATMTTFQNLQSQIKIFAFIMIILYLTVTGMQVILGSFKLDMSNIVKTGIKVAIIYYFSMGDAWKQYFYKMIFDASIGVSEIMFESIMGSSNTRMNCNFTGNSYSISKGQTCIFPNLDKGGTFAPTRVLKSSRFGAGDAVTQAVLEENNEDDGSNKPSVQTDSDKYNYMCVKGPFIFIPEYGRLHKPVIYYSLTKIQYIRKVMQMYCVNKEQQTMRAKLILNDVTNEPKIWTCPIKGYKLEEGYRLSVLKKAGIDADKVDSSLGPEDPIKTAMWSIDEDGLPVDLFPPHSSTVDRIKEKIIRIKTINAIENIRSNTNKLKRLYPVIEKYGVKRSFDYVALFDMIDCKLISYFQYDAESGFASLANFDILSVLCGGILVLILFLMIIFMGLFIAGLVGRAVQSYLVAIIAITVLIYFTPIILPLGLFKVTEGIASDWKDKIKSYAFYPSILFMSIGTAFLVIDYSMYGSETTFKEKKMFTSDGKVNGKDCWEDDLWSAPTACLISKLGWYPNVVTTFLGTTLKLGPKPSLLPPTLLALLKTMIIILMLKSIVAQFEEVMTSMLGIKADTGLEGSIFNDANQLTGITTSILKKVKTGASNVIGGVKKGYKASRKK